MKLSEMTPEMLEGIWWSAYKAKRGEGMGVTLVIQEELIKAGWQAVLDAMISASDLEWAKRYLAMRECDAAGGY